MAITVGGRLVGSGYPALMVAEIGINHNGDLVEAIRMVRAAKGAKADCVKVQAFSADEFCSDHATYKGEQQRAMFKRYELSKEAIAAIADECRRVGVMFMGTPADEENAKLLLDCGTVAIKVGSDDLCNVPLIAAFAKMAVEHSVPLILSTGMASEQEILDALEACRPARVALLHCVSEYPCPQEHANVRRMIAMESSFEVEAVGYSDHTEDGLASVTAVALGAQIIERHFTLSRDNQGPDHAFSAEPFVFRKMVDTIRQVETILGRYDIEPSDEEKAMRIVARRSIRSRFDCKEGTLLTRGHLVFQRPGDGLSPARLDDVLGKYLVTAKRAGDNVGLEDVR